MLYYVIADASFLLAHLEHEKMGTPQLYQCRIIQYNEDDGWYVRDQEGAHKLGGEANLRRSGCDTQYSRMLGYRDKERRDLEMNKRYEAIEQEIQRRI